MSDLNDSCLYTFLPTFALSYRDKPKSVSIDHGQKCVKIYKVVNLASWW